MITSDVFADMEGCLVASAGGEGDAMAKLTDALRDARWPVRYAAAVALGELGAAARAAVPALLTLLEQEDAAPLYTQPGNLAGGPAGSNMPMTAPANAADPVTLDAWRRRGRIKQAAIWALHDIGISTPAVRAALQRYAVDQGEDYAVRAAACRALARLGDEQSVPVLKQATQDGEWCTACEARKSLQALTRSRSST
jgi:HEAT repeat protein